MERSLVQEFWSAFLVSSYPSPGIRHASKQAMVFPAEAPDITEKRHQPHCVPGPIPLKAESMWIINRYKFWNNLSHYNNWEQTRLKGKAATMWNSPQYKPSWNITRKYAKRPRYSQNKDLWFYLQLIHLFILILYDCNMFLVSHNNLRATVTNNLRGLRLTLQEMSLLRGKKCVKKKSRCNRNLKDP